MFDTLNDTVFSLNPEGGVTWSIAFEPLVGAMLESSQYNNVLGLELAEDGFSKSIGIIVWTFSDNFIVVLISALWPNSAVSSDIQAIPESVLSTWQNKAHSNGLSQRFQYLNYAAPFQKPFESYGKDDLRLLKSVSGKYDERQILQKKVGGFKVSS